MNLRADDDLLTHLGQIGAVAAVPAQVGGGVSYLRGLLPAGAKSHPPDRLAYVDAAGIQVVEGSSTTRSRLLLPTSTAQGGSVGALSWSANGRYLAATIDTGVERYVWAYDFQEGHDLYWDSCDCQDVAVAGNDLLSLTRGTPTPESEPFPPSTGSMTAGSVLEHQTLRLFHLDTGAPEDKVLTLRSTGPVVGQDQLQVLAGAESGLVVAAPDPTGTAAYGGPQNIYMST